MNEKKIDFYPDLGLDDIIKILHDKDRQRLDSEDFSDCGVKICPNLSYKSDGNMYHDFDIYYGNPRSKTLPTIIIVHGGGLVYGTKELNKNSGISFAQNDFNVANINYRLLPKVSFVDQVKDVSDAFSYIYENSSKLGINHDKIFILSDSAGSFLTLAAFALMKDENIRHIFDLDALDFNISGMGFISPMTGLVKSGSLALINEPAKRDFTNDQIPFIDNILRVLGNITLPPSIVITSEEDFIRDQALCLKDYLDSKNIENKFIDFKKKDFYPLEHGFAISHPHLAESDLVLNEIGEFFKYI